jgi:cleavage and polyadenylation specificity factor subunit 1
LRVYEVQENISSQGKPKLVQCGEFSFHGNIQSLEKIKLRHSLRESLILSFYDAKLSIVEYDPDTNRLKTLSMHQFEDNELQGGKLNNDCRPVVRVDPDGRCAAMLVYGSHIAVCPFYQDSVMDTPSSPLGDTQDILSSYTISLKTLSEPVINVRDMAFLEGYTSPTLLILCEPNPTWSGRISLRQDSKAVIGLSLNTADKVHPVIWSVKQLPFDALYLQPVPKPLGGVLLFGANTLIYLNQVFSYYFKQC